MTRLTFTTALLATLILGLAAPAFAGGDTMSYEDALASARERDTVVLIDFFTDWCVWCKVFDKDLANPETGIAAALESVAFTSIDAEKGEGIELARKYGVTVFPTYTVVTPEGELVASWYGFGGPEHFLENFEDAVADPIPYEQKVARYEADPTADRAQQLSWIAAASGRFEAGMAYLVEAEELDPQLNLSEDMLDQAYTRFRKDESFGTEDYLALAHERVIEHDAAPSATVLTAYYVGKLSADEADHATLKPYLVKARKAMASGEELSPGLVNAVELQALLYLDEDEAAAVEMKRASMPEGWMDDANALNSFAWWCFENGVDLEEAQQLALRGVELAEPGSERAQILDTAAEICNALGNCDEAVALTERAIEQHPTNRYYDEQLERFQAIRDRGAEAEE
jgi:tetratricopeptide (TPR) repeat protein